MDLRAITTLGRRRANGANRRAVKTGVHQIRDCRTDDPTPSVTHWAREYKHITGEISKVLITQTGIGFREVRIAGLPPEVHDATIQAALEKYGDIRGFSRQKWPQQYRYKKSNGVRLVTIQLKKHIPSQMTIAGSRTLVTYDGQETTCFACNEHGHI